MLLTVTPLENPGPPSPVPPPTPPKPRKDNAKLQRLIRKAAKKSAVQASPTLTTKSFRSTLSPVSEADLESIESTNTQKHKKPPSLNLPPRFQIKGVTHRSPSPYPKQKFTFTVPEQQSLSQYLSPSPVPDTPSPIPFRPTSPNIFFLNPQGGNNPDRLSPRAIANSSPRPCTPKAVEPPQKQPTVPHIQSISPPEIIIQMTNGDSTGPFSPNKDETVNKMQQDEFSTPKCEDTNISKVSSCPRSIPDQQESTYKSNGYSPSPANKPIQAESTTVISKMTDKKDTAQGLSTVGGSTTNTSVDQAITAISSTDYPDGDSKVSVKTVQINVTISPPTGTTQVTSSKVVSAKPDMVPTEEITILKPPEKPKPPRKKPGGGWARLVKHLVVEPEEPKFPEQEKAEGKTEKSTKEKKDNTEGTQTSKSNRANNMWDALLYRMASTNKEQEKPGPSAPQALPFFRSRLPLLLHRPRFDARKLKEAASRPLRRVTAFFHRRVAEKEVPSSFNRTASGWSIRGENAEQEDEKKVVDEEMKQ